MAVNDALFHLSLRAQIASARVTYKVSVTSGDLSETKIHLARSFCIHIWYVSILSNFLLFHNIPRAPDSAAVLFLISD